MQSVVYIIFAIGMGAIVSVYMPMISETSKIMGSPLAGNIPFFAISFATSVLLYFLFSNTGSMSNFNEVPMLYWIAGVLSAFMIVGMSILIPILGVRQFIILIIAGQIIMSAIAGHFGWFGLPSDVISLQKIFGIVLVLTGVFFTVAESPLVE